LAAPEKLEPEKDAEFILKSLVVRLAHLIFGEAADNANHTISEGFCHIVMIFTSLSRKPKVPPDAPFNPGNLRFPRTPPPFSREP
jgi:hypothetical protein